MLELTRFQNLRPVQWMPLEEVRHTGLSLYPDDKLSPLATALATASDREHYSALIARYREHHKSDIVTSIDGANSVVRTLYDWLNYKARPIAVKDFEQIVSTLKANDLPDMEEEWRRYADNLILAIDANLLSKNYCVDFQLIIKIFHLIKRALKKAGAGYKLNGDVTVQVIEQLLSQLIILPIGAVFGRCRKKCSERNSIRSCRHPGSLKGAPIASANVTRAARSPSTTAFAFGHTSATCS